MNGCYSPIFFMLISLKTNCHSTDKKMTSSNLNPQAVSFGKGYCTSSKHRVGAVWTAARDHYESLAADLEQGRPWSRKASEHPVEPETWDVIMMKSSQGQKMYDLMIVPFLLHHQKA